MKDHQIFLVTILIIVFLTVVMAWVCYLVGERNRLRIKVQALKTRLLIIRNGYNNRKP